MTVADENSTFADAREHVRIKDKRRVSWYLRDIDKKGDGVVRNISSSGMLLETSNGFDPHEPCYFAFDSTLGQDNYIPQNGQLVWFRKTGLLKKRYLCGIRFIQPADYVKTRLRKRIQKGLGALHIQKKTQSVLEVLFVGGIIFFAGYLLWESASIYQNVTRSNDVLVNTSDQQAALTQSYAHRYHAAEIQIAGLEDELTATTQLYRESESMLAGVRTDLVATRDILTETEGLLSRTQAELTTSEQQLAATRTQLTQSQSRLAEVQRELSQRDQILDNSQTDLQATQAELTSLRKERSVLQGRVEYLESLNNANVTAANQDLKNSIALLQDKNQELTLELRVLQEQMTLYSGQVQNEEEAQAVMNILQDRLREIRQRVNHFKSESEQIRRAAQDERDKLKLALGNNGYFMRDGQSVDVDYEKYQSVNKLPAQALVEVSSPAASEPSVTSGAEPAPVADPPAETDDPRRIRVKVELFEE